MDLYERIMELGSMGYHCSQIIMIMTLETIGEENPQLVKAMGGLGGGIGYCGDTCGSTLINALGDIPYDELEELLNRDRSQLHRWNKASEMREHRPKRLDHCKIPHDELGTYVAAHQGLFDSSLPIFAAASSIIEREFSVMLIVQRKYVVDYE